MVAPASQSPIAQGLEWSTRIMTVGLIIALPILAGYGVDRWLGVETRGDPGRRRSGSDRGADPVCPARPGPSTLGAGAMVPARRSGPLVFAAASFGGSTESSWLNITAPTALSTTSSTIRFWNSPGATTRSRRSPWGCSTSRSPRFMVMETVAALAILLIMIPLARHVARRPVTRGLIGNAFEAALLYFRDAVARPALGKHGADEFLPYLWTIFFFILFMNLLGMIPGGASPTGQHQRDAGSGAGGPS